MHPLQLQAHIFSIGPTATEEDMSAPETFTELHRLGGFVSDQHEGRKDQPVTGADLYNLAVQLDSNFASVRSEIGYLRTDMTSEFKAVRSEIGYLRTDMTAEFKVVRSEIGSLRTDMTSEFKAVRADMKEGFALINLRFAELSKEISSTNWRVAGSVIVAMIALLGIDRFWQ